MDVLELERLLVQRRRCAGSPVHSQARDVGEVLVVALRLAVLGLVLDPEVAAAATPRGARASRHISSAELEEVGDPAGLLERLVDAVAVAERPARPCWNSSRSAGISDERLLEALPGCAPCRSSPT